MIACTMPGGVPNVGGHSVASRTASRAAGSRAHVEKAAAVPECLDDGVNGAGDFGKLAAHCGGNQGILTIQDAQNIER